VARTLIATIVIFSCLLSTGSSLAANNQEVAKPASHVSASKRSSKKKVSQPPVFPVRFSETEILRISSSPVSSLTPENRAKLIQQNIQGFAEGSSDVNGLRLFSIPEGIGIGDDHATLMVVTTNDAVVAGQTSASLASEILSRIQESVNAYRTAHALETYGLGAAYSLLAIIGLWLALYWNKRAFAWLVRRVMVLHDHWKGGIAFKQVEVISAKRIERILLILLKTLKIFIILLCLDFFLPLILSFFPETRKLSSQIFDYLITPFVTIFHAVIKFIPNLFFIFVIIVIAYYFLKSISYVFKLIEKGELKIDWFYEDWALPTYQIIRFLVIIIALISAYPYIPGSSSQAFQGIGLVLGAFISFASSSAIANIVSGIILTYTRAFRLGDRIQVGDTIGDVVEKTLLVTRVETIKHVVVTIPNSLVMGSQIINFSTSAADGDGVIVHTTVTIGYDVPWKQVKTLLVESALATKNILEKPDPYVLQTALDDFYVSYEINAFTKEPKYMAFTYSDLHRNILEKFDAAGIEIMSPHYYSLRDGNASTVPSVLGTEGYTQPGFKVDKGSATDSR